MSDYEQMYLKLFNKVSQAIEILQQAQLEGEDIFVESAPKSEVEE